MPVTTQRRKKLAALPVSLAVLTAAAGFCVWQNNDIVVSEYTYVSAQVPASFDGYTIVQISDLHNKLFGKEQSRLLEAIRTADPDMIVVTGDIVDSMKTDLSPVFSFAQGAAKIAPVYYVTGNHEHRLSEEDYWELMDGLENAGVTVLKNRLVTVDNGEGETIDLVGLLDLDMTSYALPDILENADKSRLQILLAHQPEHAAFFAECGADLIFAGHAHGGQVRLPLIGGLYAPGQGVFPEYTAGPYEIGESCLIVSRGLGNSGYTFRVFNRPEVVVVTLKTE